MSAEAAADTKPSVNLLKNEWTTHESRGHTDYPLPAMVDRTHFQLS
jgi:hypothetical protein